MASRRRRTRPRTTATTHEIRSQPHAAASQIHTALVPIFASCPYRPNPTQTIVLGALVASRPPTATVPMTSFGLEQDADAQVIASPPSMAYAAPENP
jgi:hypothetical protein